MFVRRLLLVFLSMVWLHSAATASVSRTSPPVPAAQPIDVLLISIDTLRADATGFSGNAGARTPNLDRLAAQGRHWRDAHAHSVTTLPSHASILTGLYPYQHGARENGRFVLSEDVPTMATLLGGAGYATAAFVGAYPLDGRFGLDRGFDLYDDDYEGRSGDQVFKLSERPANLVVDRASRWWQANQSRPRFMFVHLFDAHSPYEPPAPFARDFETNPYQGEVAWLDFALTPLLEGFLSGRERPALVVLTSDHGEALGHHGETTHGLFAYESTLKVPLVVWGPGLQPAVEPGVEGRPARLIDILPTVAAATGVAIDSEIPGQSLLEPVDENPPTYFEALSANLDYGWAPLRGVIHGRTKLIQLPVPELYDLEADPMEERNLFDSDRPRARELASMLPAESEWPPRAEAVGSKEAARLRSLGYLGGAESPRTRYGSADDPKNLVELDRKMTALPRLYALGKVPEAVRLARDVLAERPQMTLASLYLARFELALGEVDKALATLETSKVLGTHNPELISQLGLVLVKAGRPREALALTDSVGSAETDSDLLNVQAIAFASLGENARARTLLDRVLDLAPESALALETRSFLSIQEENYAEARRFADTALAIDDSRPDSWNNLGVALYWLGSKERALDAWQRCLELDPRNLDARLSLGLVAAETGDLAEGREHLRRFIETAPSPRYDDAKRQASAMLRQLG